MGTYLARWMFAIEHNKVDARETNSLHPLWSQYVFSFRCIQSLTISIDMPSPARSVQTVTALILLKMIDIST